MAEAKASQPVKKTTQPTAKATKDENSELKKEIETLKQDLSKMSDLEKRLEEMTRFISTMGESDKEEKPSLILEDEIPVISQCMGVLKLSTEGNGRGTVYTFENFGDIEDIPYGDLKDIVRNNKSFAEDGLFYIASDVAVEKLRLKNYYKRMLNNEDMINLFNNDANIIIELYKLAPEGQREVIIDMVVDKKFNGDDVDANILIQLGNLSGKKLVDIEKFD